MELKVDDFKEDTLSLDDFQEESDKGIALNRQSASQLAATQTLLSTGQPEEYTRLQADLMDPKNKSNFQAEQDNINSIVAQDAQESLVDVLADPSVDDETKVQLLNLQDQGFNTTIKQSTSVTLAEEAGIADSEPEETGRTAQGRNLMLDSVNRVAAHKREMMKAINSVRSDQGTAGNVLDVVELMAPFAEWIHYDRLLASVNGESDSNLLGEQKQQLFDFIRDRPLDERAAMVESLVDIIKNSDTIVLPDGNDLATVEALERMFIENDYSDFERYFDNVTSVLDVIGGVGAVIRGGAKAPKIAKAADKIPNSLEEEALKFEAEVPVTDPNLAKEAADFKTEAEPTAEGVFKEKPKPQTEADLKAEAEAFRTDNEPTADTVFRKAKSEAVRSDVNPTAPSQVVKDYNPALARDMNKMVDEDTTGKAAEGLYGTTREEALAKDLLPEPSVDGKMPNKVEMEPQFEEPAHLRRVRRSEGNTIVNDKEFQALRSKISAGLSEIEGMVIHPSSMIIRANPSGTTTFMARYSPVDSGFATPNDAIEAAQAAFRNYGLKETDFTILARRGDTWEEAKLNDLNAEIDLTAAGAKFEDGAVDYAIGMKYEYRFDPSDLAMIERDLSFLTTAPGYIAGLIQRLDRIPGQFLASKGQGSIVQNVLDAASVIHPQIVNAASVAVDKTFSFKKLYVEQFEEFAEAYKALDKERQALMTDYIQEANLKGLKFDPSELYARGFTTKEVENLKQWRRANDAMWHAANDDMGKSLRAQGVKVFRHQASDTKLMGRGIGRPQGGKQGVLDMSEGTVVGKTKDEIDHLYDSGGEIVKLLEPIEIDGRWVDEVFSPNSPDGGYLRRIRDEEYVLAYRDGYYPVMYDANFFVYKKVKGSDGKEHQKVFATAKNSKEVEKLRQDIMKADNLTEEEFAQQYGSRKDRRIENPTNSIFEEGSWNIASNAGLTSQRVRGKRLEEAGADLHKSGMGHLIDPLEAVTQQLHSLSVRTSLRTYMDTAKTRWQLQYGKYLDLPIDPRTGKAGFPSSPNKIVGKDNAPAKMVADARTNFNYLHGLENGYINGMDHFYKGILNQFAEAMGEVGFAKGEELAFAGSKLSPVQTFKTGAFKLFISANPARQAVLQRGQVMMLGAFNPKYVATSLTTDYMGLQRARFGLTKDKKYLDLWDEMKDAGILEAVDAHTLIRDDLLSMADVTWNRTAAGAPLRTAQKVGFDAAEQDVLITAWLASRDNVIQTLKKGEKVTDQRVKDRILGEARAFTLNMNRSGEMPYSQNTLGMVAQFFSFRHKALMQGLTNRNLSAMERAKLLGYTTALFGMDATIFYSFADSIFGKEPSELKDKVTNGLLDTTLNAALTAASGEKQAIDFGDLAPTEAYGMGQLLFTAMGTSLTDIMTNTPAGSLAFGANPRVNDAMKTGLRYFNVADDYDDPELDTKLSDVSLAFMNLFSGASNAFKARYAYQTGQKMSGSGRITDEDVTKVEAAAQLFGFRTKHEEGIRQVNELRFEGRSFLESDVDAWYNELKRHLGRRQMSVTEQDFSQRVLREAWRVFGEDRPRVQELIARRLENDAKNGDFKTMTGIYRNMGLISEDETWKIINKMPAGKQRDMLVDGMNVRKEMLDGN